MHPLIHHETLKFKYCLQCHIKKYLKKSGRKAAGNLLLPTSKLVESCQWTPFDISHGGLTEEKVCGVINIIVSEKTIYKHS